MQDLTRFNLSTGFNQPAPSGGPVTLNGLPIPYTTPNVSVPLQTPLSTRRQRLAAGLVSAGEGMRTGGIAGAASGAAQAVLGLINNDRTLQQQQLYRQRQMADTADLLNTAGSNGTYTKGMFATLTPEQQVAFLNSQNQRGERNAMGQGLRYYTKDQNAPDMPVAPGQAVLKDFSDNAQRFANFSRAEPSARVGIGLAQNPDLTGDLGGVGTTAPTANTTPLPVPTAPLNTNGLTPRQKEAVAIAQKYKLPPETFLGLIENESAFNEGAISPDGAIGLGQLMPATAKSLGVDPYNPAQNLDGAARYLAQQLQSGKGSVNAALAGYIGGPGGQRDYLRGVNRRDSNDDTFGYIDKIAKSGSKYKKMLGGTTQVVQNQPTATAQAPATTKNPTSLSTGLTQGDITDMFGLNRTAQNAVANNIPLNPYNPLTAVPDTDKMLNVTKAFVDPTQKNEDQAVDVAKVRVQQQEADQTGQYYRDLAENNRATQANQAEQNRIREIDAQRPNYIQGIMKLINEEPNALKRRQLLQTFLGNKLWSPQDDNEFNLPGDLNGDGQISLLEQNLLNQSNPLFNPLAVPVPTAVPYGNWAGQGTGPLYPKPKFGE